MESIRCPGCMREKTQRPLCEHCGYNEHIDNYAHQLPVGTMLRGRYQIGKVLGQGGFGITYIGWDQLRQMPVAIKEFYPKSLVGRENSRTNLVSTLEREGSEPFARGKEKFLKEAKTLARLNDIPEIVHIYNYFEENNTAYMVMEYLKGADLRRYVRMKGGRISLEKALTVMRPIMGALQRVHEESLVHRDISPDNIMLLPGGAIKLLDFGAAREVLNAAPDKQLSHSTEAVLKHGFAPIEQYQTSGTLGPWTDVYALTATMYYCLTGTVPPEVHKRLLEGALLQWTDVPGLTGEQIKTLEQAMAILPTDRIRSVKELEEALYAGTTRQEGDTLIDFRVDNGGGGQVIADSGLFSGSSWKLTSGGGIAENTESRKLPEVRQEAPEKKKKKHPAKRRLKTTALAALVLVSCAATTWLGFSLLKRPVVSGEADRTIRYADGSRAEVFLNDAGQETGRILRDEDQAVLYQFTAGYDRSGNLTEQKVYDPRGRLLRTDVYTYDDNGSLTRSESRNGKDSLLWEGLALYSGGGRLTGFREEYADGSTVEWTYDENGNVTEGLYLDAAGAIRQKIKYTEFYYFCGTERRGVVNHQIAAQMAARGGYGVSPMAADWLDPGSGGGGGGEEKPKRPIAIAITEPEETWEETTEATEAVEELQIWHDHDDNASTAIQAAPDVIKWDAVRLGSSYQLYAITPSHDSAYLGKSAQGLWTSSNEKVASVDTAGTVTFNGTKGEVTIQLRYDDGTGRVADSVVFRIGKTDSGEGIPAPTWPEEEISTEPTEEPIVIAVTEPEETGAEDWSDVTLWVNSRRTRQNEKLYPEANYETLYDDTGLATGEICRDYFGKTLYESRFLYSGGELTGEERTAPDGTVTVIAYIRDIYGNAVMTWTQAEGEKGTYEETDLSERYNG